MKVKKIDTQTYQIDDYVIFKLENGKWKMGKIIYQDTPVEMQREGTVTLHKTKKDAVKAWHSMKRRERKGL